MSPKAFEGKPAAAAAKEEQAALDGSLGEETDEQEEETITNFHAVSSSTSFTATHQVGALLQVPPDGSLVDARRAAHAPHRSDEGRRPGRCATGSRREHR